MLAVTRRVATGAGPQALPAAAVIGPAEEFQDLFTLAAARHPDPAPLPVAPRQIPLHRRHDLFRARPLERLLAEAARLRSLVFGVEGDWPELEIECWAIRD